MAADCPWEALVCGDVVMGVVEELHETLSSGALRLQWRCSS
jgi:hypothetical protein